MTEQDYNHLEALLSKLHLELGCKYCILPSAHNDMPSIATYKDDGSIDQSEIGPNIQEVVKIIKTKKEIN